MKDKDLGFLQDWLIHHVFRPLHGPAYWAALIGSVIGFVLLFAILHQLSSRARKQLTVVCAFIAGLFYSVEFFCPPTHLSRHNPLTGYIEPLGTFLIAVGSFAFGLGLISLCHLHGRNLFRFSKGWENSLAFFVSLIAMLVFSFWRLYRPQNHIASDAYRVMFDGFLNALGSTTFSLLAFFIVSAAYRAFRVNTLEATLMMIAAFVVMLGQVPIGQAITAGLPDSGVLASLRLERINHWILVGINSAAFRGIIFGAAVGKLAMALRVWLSLEKGAYFEQQL